MNLPDEDLSKALPNYLWNEEKINVKALMTIRGLKQAEIASRYGFFPSEVSRVVSGNRTTPQIRRAIAQELGMQVEQLWPPKKPREIA